MTTMKDLIAERADAFMRHCVAGVTKQGKDKAAAFAICKAGGNKAGYYTPGTKTKTAKGTKAIRAHARAADAPGKDAAYERAVKSEGVMGNMRMLIDRMCETADGESVVAEELSDDQRSVDSLYRSIETLSAYFREGIPSLSKLKDSIGSKMSIYDSKKLNKKLIKEAQSEAAFLKVQVQLVLNAFNKIGGKTS